MHTRERVCICVYGVYRDTVPTYCLLPTTPFLQCLFYFFSTFHLVVAAACCLATDPCSITCHAWYLSISRVCF
ncbi:hypothetical protein BKA80DRAFT_283718 [Phyllosticta citrichinensis]